MEDEHETSSLRSRRKKSSLSLSCCFSGNGNGRNPFDALESLSSFSSTPQTHRHRRSPSCWVKSKLGRRRHASADFSYDALSYSLNFEEEHVDDEDFPPRNFSSRLQMSPPRSRVLPSATKVELTRNNNLEIPVMKREDLEVPRLKGPPVVEGRRSVEVLSPRELLVNTFS